MGKHSAWIESSTAVMENTWIVFLLMAALAVVKVSGQDDKQLKDLPAGAAAAQAGTGALGQLGALGGGLDGGLGYGGLPLGAAGGLGQLGALGGGLGGGLGQLGQLGGGVGQGIGGQMGGYHPWYPNGGYPGQGLYPRYPYPYPGQCNLKPRCRTVIKCDEPE